MSDTATTERAQTDAQTQPEPTAKLPAAVALRGGGSIRAIIPQDFDQAYRMARIIAASGTAPKSYMMKDPTDLKEFLSVERIAVAIMHGLEVGLPPMQAVQGIAVINGMPTVYADAQDALVEASGLLEDRVEEHELDSEGLFLWWRCTVKRKGRPTPIVQTITRPQAARAGWLKKQGPWTESPNRMAQRRARGWAYRDAFPDVLKGLVDRDEALEMVDITNTGSATTTPAEPRRSDFVKKAAPVTIEDEPEPEGWPLYDETGETVGRFGVDEWMKRFLDAAPKLQNGDRANFLEANLDVAKAFADDKSLDGKTDAVSELYLTDVNAKDAEPRPDAKKAEPEPETLLAGGTGQEEIANNIVKLIVAATSEARVNAILATNAERMKKWTQGNRAKVTIAADDKLEDLSRDAGA